MPWLCLLAVKCKFGARLGWQPRACLPHKFSKMQPVKAQSRQRDEVCLAVVVYLRHFPEEIVLRAPAEGEVDFHRATNALAKAAVSRSEGKAFFYVFWGEKRGNAARSWCTVFLQPALPGTDADREGEERRE